LAQELLSQLNSGVVMCIHHVTLVLCLVQIAQVTVLIQTLAD